MQLTISYDAGPSPDFYTFNTQFFKIFQNTFDFQASIAHLNKHEKLQMISRNLS